MFLLSFQPSLAFTLTLPHYLPSRSPLNPSSHTTHNLDSFQLLQKWEGEQREEKTNFSPDNVLLLKTLLPNMFSLWEVSSTSLPKDHMFGLPQKNLSSQKSQSIDVRDSPVKMSLLSLLTFICECPIAHFLPQGSMCPHLNS